jgi:lipopolysaccharide export system permease protein
LWLKLPLLLIKKLDILIIRSFIGPFIVTFFISLFVLIMQFFWLYMDEMIGKGINIWMLIQLLVYMSTTLVPLALPLSVLLSSIMTFGSLGENYELVAIKSSGISLLRFMRPLFLLIVFIAYLAFLFSDNVIPVANLKALSLLYDVRNSKPTLNIRPDQFNNEIPGYSIRVGSKDKDGNTIHDIIIYDHTDLTGNNKVILAKKGEMIASPDKQSLIFKLTDGWRYEEGMEHGYPDYSQTRMHFAKWNKVFDLSSLNFTRTNESLFKDAYQMYNVKQLRENIDSFNHSQKKTYNIVSGYMAPYVTWNNTGKESTVIEKKITGNSLHTRSYDTSFMQLVPDSSRVAVIQSVMNNIRNLKSLMDMTSLDRSIQKENYLKLATELHRKYTLSFACILLFLIGAPLGAIIRKGGLGMPLVIAVVFFMTFHILNITGEKLVKTGSVAPWEGMWMSTGILLPLAIWLIIAARNDSQVFNKEWYVRIWRRIKGLLPLKDKAIA